MFKLFAKWIERGLTWWGLITGTGLVSLATVIGFISHAIAVATPWISRLGPYGVFLATMVGVFTVLGAVWVCFAVWGFTVSMRVRKKWMESADGINPIDREFHRKRIRISDVALPLTGYITGKRFIDCEINGPVILHMTSKNVLVRNIFHNCDIVYVPNDRLVNTAIVVDSNEFTGCQWYKCTIYTTEETAEWFKIIDGINFISLTGDSEFDTPQLPEPVGNKPL